MIIELLQMFWIFFKVGLFTIGGGLAAIPLIQTEVINRGWLTQAEFADMIAVSESTPGPIGVNVATYVGYSQLGPIGSIIATMGIVMPSLIIIMLIARFILKFKENKYIEGVFVGLRPAVTGLILGAAASISFIAMFRYDMFLETGSIMDLINIPAFIMFGVFMFLTNKWKHHPIYYIVLAGIVGMIVF